MLSRRSEFYDPSVKRRPAFRLLSTSVSTLKIMVPALKKQSKVLPLLPGQAELASAWRSLNSQPKKWEGDLFK
jgi:hypothetical protein